jgi:hypothetical protein
VGRIREFVDSHEPFICKDIQECMTHNDKLKKEIVDILATMQKLKKQM